MVDYTTKNKNKTTTKQQQQNPVLQAQPFFLKPKPENFC